MQDQKIVSLDLETTSSDGDSTMNQIEELTAKIQQYDRDIQRLNNDLNDMNLSLKFCKNADDYDTTEIKIAEASATRSKLVMLRLVQLTTLNKLLSLRDHVCFKCLENNVTRGASTQYHDGFPICMSHHKDVQKAAIKVPVINTQIYTKTGNLADYLK